MDAKDCCVDSCSSSSVREQDKGVTFHRLPKNPQLRAKWIKQTKINLECIQNKCKYICSRHFRKIDFEPYKASKFALKPNAIPTIFSWGITPLEDLDKIFPPDEIFEPPKPRMSTDSEVKSDTETKSASSKDSEEDAKSDIEVPEESIAAMERNEDTDTCKEEDIDDSINDSAQLSLDDTVISSKIDDNDTNEFDAKEHSSLHFESTELPVKSSAIENIDTPVLPLKKKRGRKSKQEILTARIAARAFKLQSSLEKGNLLAAGKDGKKPRRGRPAKVHPVLPASPSLGDDVSVTEIDDSTVSIKDEIDQSPIQGTAEDQKPITEDIKKELPSIEETMFSDVKIEIVSPKKEMANFSPMLKALIEKKTPMTRPKFLPSASTSKTFDSVKYTSPSSSEKGLVPGARVEAKDFSEQWYAARIMEVDHEEMEVLIHYDNWSQRYDEWISMSSPRLRMLEAPVGPPAVATPPTYVEGERCLARWSDNRRFVATVQKVLPDGKYEVKFDDGFVRTIKWNLMFKVTVASSLGSSPTPSPIPTLPSPAPYASRKLTPTQATAPTSVPPPVHNHLFDPSRDHLGSKEERRDMKRKLNVKELFSAKKKKAIQLNKVDETVPPQPDNDVPIMAKYETDISQLLKGEWSCHWLDDLPVGEVMPRGPSSQPSKGGEEAPRLKRISVKVEDHRLPPGWIKYLTRRCVGHSAGKWDVVLVCPAGKRYRSRFEINARLSEPDMANLTSYHHCLRDFSVHRKLARRLGWDHSSNREQQTGPFPIFKRRKEPSRKASPALKIKKEGRVGSPTLKSTKERADSPSVKIKMESEQAVLPAIKINSEQSRGRSPVVKVKKNRDRASPLLSIRRDDAELSGIRSEVSGIGHKVNREKGKARSPALKIRTPGGSGSPLLPILKIKLEGAQCKVEYPGITDEPVPGTPSTPGLIQETPQTPSYPPLEDGFIYVGSLKVQVIDNLLRCPKEGCFKNFRKENFLQMHIKHYHTDMCTFLGDTPNVADLAYARTIVEDAKSAEKSERKPREKKSALQTSATSKLSQISTPKIVPIVKEEILDIPLDNMPTRPITPLKNTCSLDILDKSPKLRTLLESKPDVKLEPGLSNIKRELPHDVDDLNSSFQMERDPLEIHPHIKLETSKSSKPGKHRLEKDISKNRVKSIISKIVAEQGNRSRSESPVAKQSSPYPEYRTSTDDIKPDLEMDIFPTPHKSKKKSKKRHSEVPEVHKKKKSKPLDIWTAFNDDHDETRSSFGSPDMIAANSTINTIPDPISLQLKEEVKDIDPSTFVTETGEKIKIVHMKREEIINCHCGFGEEDGLMIQCELCLCWQHAICHNIEKESEVPEKYVCRICLNPPRGRRSQRYLNSQEWLYEGRLPSATRPAEEADPRRALALRRSHQMAGNLLHCAQLLHSLRCKIQVSQKKDHPKLYLWSKPWDEEAAVTEPADEYSTEPFEEINIEQVKLESLEVEEVNMDEDMYEGVPKCDHEVELSTSDGLQLPITKSDIDTLTETVQGYAPAQVSIPTPAPAPQPEAAIDPAECRLRLLQHVERTQALLDARLDSIEAQIAELESQDPSLADDEGPDYHPRTKETIQMLLRDLTAMEEFGMISSNS